jgi:hypothetical protein
LLGTSAGGLVGVGYDNKTRATRERDHAHGEKALLAGRMTGVGHHKLRAHALLHLTDAGVGEAGELIIRGAGGLLEIAGAEPALTRGGRAIFEAEPPPTCIHIDDGAAFIEDREVCGIRVEDAADEIGLLSGQLDRLLALRDIDQGALDNPFGRVKGE